MSWDFGTFAMAFNSSTGILDQSPANNQDSRENWLTGLKQATIHDITFS